MSLCLRRRNDGALTFRFSPIRHHTNPVGTEWRWKMDDPEFIVNGAMKNHYEMIKAFKGAILRLEHGLWSPLASPVPSSCSPCEPQVHLVCCPSAFGKQTKFATARCHLWASPSCTLKSTPFWTTFISATFPPSWSVLTLKRRRGARSWGVGGRGRSSRPGQRGIGGLEGVRRRQHDNAMYREGMQ